MLRSAVRAVVVLFVLILGFSERKETVRWYPYCKVRLRMSECTVCKYRKCFLHRFFPVNFHRCFSNSLYTSTGVMCSCLYSN